MRALLANIPFGSRVAAGRYNRAWPPLDLLTTAALLRNNGLRVDLWDGRAGADRARLAAPARSADLTILSTGPLDRWQCPNVELEPIAETARYCPKERLFICGPQGTVAPEAIMNLTGARGVIRGEPELTALELADGGPLSAIAGLTYREAGEIRSNPDRTALDLDQLPPPAYDLIDLDRYGYPALGDRLALVEAARGCRFNCTFCLKAMYGPGVRGKSVDRTVDELTALIRDHRPGCLYFIDLDFLARPDRADRLAREMIRRRLGIDWACQARVDHVTHDRLRLLKAAGLRLIHLGVETGDPAALHASAKGVSPDRIEAAFAAARRTGVRAAGFFQVGLNNLGPTGPGLAQARQTLAWAKKLNPTLASFHVSTPYPGTAAARSLDNGGDWTDLAARQAARLEQWDPFLRRAYLSYYLRPGYAAANWADLARSGLPGLVRLWWSFLS